MEFERKTLIALYVISMVGILVTGWAGLNVEATYLGKSLLIFPLIACFTMAFVIGTTLRRG